jgi:hypothetical protein
MVMENVFEPLVGPTQGEWMVVREAYDFEIVITQDGRAPWRLAGYISREEDARLMAAALEMYEALKSIQTLVAYVSASTGLSKKVFNIAEAAIAKAECR